MMNFAGFRTISQTINATDQGFEVLFGGAWKPAAARVPTPDNLST